MWKHLTNASLKVIYNYENLEREEIIYASDLYIIFNIYNNLKYLPWKMASWSQISVGTFAIKQ